MSVAFPLPSLGDTEARRAALALHGAHASDREWLIAQLVPPQRSLVRALLAELDALGLPRDAAMAGHGLACTEPARHSARAWHPDDADPCALANVLLQEPASLVAEVLGLMSAPCRDRVLALLDRRRVQVPMPEARHVRSQPRTARAAALIEALRSRLAGLEATPVRRNPVDRLKSWLKSWLKGATR
ncbi:MAG TPA: hypothetical protein VHA82_20110 [Ramlibacter sp.]|uniref:hypothetical protein n=1 Tax=Ramlibacter sp. TaxID=1917967 RepID=UPI002B9CDD57|nr:hypothetical protein [Ramlibacter sp.]HVZ46122.1 hypothetical protein [Ramlibacter sp.]